MATPAFIYRKTQTLGKTQFIIGRRGFTLCRRNEYGVINLKKKCMIKQTHLYREYILRVRSRAITAEFYDLKKKGLDDWPEYQEHKASIRELIFALRRAYKEYKARRIQAGFFYTYSDPNVNKVHVMSPLYTMPRQEALKKIRRLRRNRQAYQARASTETTCSGGSIRSKCVDSARILGRRRIIQISLLYLFVIILACMIVFL